MSEPIPPQLPNHLQSIGPNAPTIGFGIAGRRQYGSCVIDDQPTDDLAKAVEDMWASDPDPFALALEAAPTSEEMEEFCGQLHCDPLRSRGPYGLPTWHVTAQRHVAERIAALLGGQPGQPSNAGFVEFATEVTELAISIPGPGAIRLRWHAGSSFGFCDASEDSGLCVCPSTIMGRRRAARLGRGCEPQAQMWFRLSGAPLLGLFGFTSGNWSFAEDIIAAGSLLRGCHGLVNASLSLDRVSGMLSSGQAVVFSRPTLSIG